MNTVLSQVSFMIDIFSCHNDSLKISNEKVFTYGSTNDTVENAKLYQLSCPEAEGDFFLRDLLIILKSHPSLEKSAAAEQTKLSHLIGGEKQLSQSLRSSLTSKKRGKAKKGQTNENFMEKMQGPNSEIVPPVRHFSMPRKRTLKETLTQTKIIDKTEIMFSSAMKTLSSCTDPLFDEAFLESKKVFLECLPQVDKVQGMIPKVVEVLIRIVGCKSLKKIDIFSSILFGGFVENLITYIILLPTDYKENSMSNDALILFLENVVRLCEFSFELMPSKSTPILKKLLRSVQYAVKGLSDCQNLIISESICINTDAVLKRVSETGIKTNQRLRMNDKEDLLKPPNNIKSISIFPTKEDLFENDIFLRKNVVDGAYKDVEHYVDVQFRLLREDFIAPLRNGIQQFCQSLNDKNNFDKSRRFDNIRIHENVKFLHGMVRNGKIGHLVRLSKSVNHYSRFMFGTLLLFTKNNFETFFCATVVDPVSKDFLVVEICGARATVDEIYIGSFTMVESEVYFEPYFHVLEALQQTDLNRFPMKQYIVDVEPQEQDAKSVSILESPNRLNASQDQAFKAAIAEEFVAIQGPPGTGKTYLALQVAKHILFNYGPPIFNSFGLSDLGLSDLDDDEDLFDERVCKYTNKRKELYYDNIYFHEEKRLDVPILVVCFTNHALDQFLEGLLTCTRKIIRVGGQSKSTELNMLNLKEIRKDFVSTEKKKRRHCSCSLCKIELHKLSRHARLKEEIEGISLSYIIYLKKLEGVSTKGFLKMQVLSPWMPRQFRAALSGEQYESWLLDGAYEKSIPENYIEEQDLSQTTKTHHLIREGRKPTLLKGIKEVNNFTEFLDNADSQANALFSINLKDIHKQSLNSQNKLNKLRKKGIDEEMLNDLIVQIDDLNRHSRYISYMLTHKVPIDHNKRIHELSKEVNVWSIDHDDRWLLYHSWLNNYKNSIQFELKCLEFSLAEAKSEMAGTTDKLDTKLLKSANVIGMTTTAAARLRNIVEIVGPEIGNLCLIYGKVGPFITGLQGTQPRPENNLARQGCPSPLRAMWHSFS